MKTTSKRIHSIKMNKWPILSGTVVLFLFATAWSCNYKIKNKEPKESSDINTEVQKEVRIAAYRTLNAWLDQGIEGIQFLQSSEWKIGDRIFLNSSNNKGFLLLLNQDKVPQAELDYVQVLYAVKEGEKWDIYLASLPNIIIPRKKENGMYIRNSFGQLAAVGEREIHRYLRKGDETNNDKGINNEFNEDLKKNNRLFLSKRIKKPSS
ncbi:hypothetical protein [Chryseobacterium sp. KMC2]|nr:hypothetical protein [Chryseobacterium sp. KMC2]MBL3549156.1 hypothetical protein [Chryseobacterium sp. KMC2]